MTPLFVLLFLCHVSNTLVGANTNNIRLRRLDPSLQEAVEVVPNPQQNTKKNPADVTINLNSHKNLDVAQAPEANKLDVVQVPHPDEPPKESIVKSSTQAPRNNITLQNHKSLKPPEMESGALLRGIAVVVILSLLVIFYMALKTYCRKHKRTVMVNKYGVRARRGDVEMTPLPLDEEDDDETVFDVNSTNR